MQSSRDNMPTHNHFQHSSTSLSKHITLSNTLPTSTILETTPYRYGHSIRPFQLRGCDLCPLRRDGSTLLESTTTPSSGMPLACICWITEYSWTPSRSWKSSICFMFKHRDISYERRSPWIRQESPTSIHARHLSWFDYDAPRGLLLHHHACFLEHRLCRGMSLLFHSLFLFTFFSSLLFGVLFYFGRHKTLYHSKLVHICIHQLLIRWPYCSVSQSWPLIRKLPVDRGWSLIDSCGL